MGNEHPDSSSSSSDNAGDTSDQSEIPTSDATTTGAEQEPPSLQEALESMFGRSSESKDTATPGSDVLPSDSDVAVSTKVTARQTDIAQGVKNDTEKPPTHSRRLTIFLILAYFFGVVGFFILPPVFGLISLLFGFAVDRADDSRGRWAVGFTVIAITASMLIGFVAAGGFSWSS